MTTPTFITPAAVAFAPAGEPNSITWSSRQWRDLVAAGTQGPPRGRKDFFEHHFQTQAALMAGLTGWLGDLSRAALHVARGGGLGEAAPFLCTAAGALDRAFAQCRDSQRGKWEHWYRGDRKANLAGALEATRQILQRFEDRRAEPFPSPTTHTP